MNFSIIREAIKNHLKTDSDDYPGKPFIKPPVPMPHEEKKESRGAPAGIIWLGIFMIGVVLGESMTGGLDHGIYLLNQESARMWFYFTRAWEDTNSKMNEKDDWLTKRVDMLMELEEQKVRDSVKRGDLK